MNSFQIECFLRVAAHLNFAHAAEELNITQPAVSHQIRILEQELGVKLFNRTTRSVSLTRDGEIFLPEADRMVIMFNSLKNKFSSAKRREMMPLQIACTSEVLSLLLPDALYRLSSEEPDVHPILRTVPMPQIGKKMAEGQADVALGLREIHSDDCTVYEELLLSPMVCVCDCTHPVCDMKEVRLADLHEYSAVLYRPTACNSDMAALHMEVTLGKPSGEIFFCETVTDALALVRAGFGISVLPRIFIPENDEHLRVIPISDVPPVSFGAYRRKDVTDLQRRFIALLKLTLGTAE